MEKIIFWRKKTKWIKFVTWLAHLSTDRKFTNWNKQNRYLIFETIDLLNGTVLNTNTHTISIILYRWKFICSDIKKTIWFFKQAHFNRVKMFEKLPQIYHHRALAAHSTLHSFTFTRPERQNDWINCKKETNLLHSPPPFFLVPLTLNPRAQLTDV